MQSASSSIEGMPIANAMIWPAHKIIASYVVWMAVALSGCSRAEFSQRSGKTNDSGSRPAASTESTSEPPQAKPPDEAKPSEQGEGVPGYLVDPDRVAVALDLGSGRIRINAATGAVSAKSGLPAAVAVSAWKVEAADRSMLEASGQTSIAATRLGGGLSSVDGSIDLEFPWDGNGFVILSTAAQVVPDRVSLGRSQGDRIDTALIDLTDDGGRLVSIGSLKEEVSDDDEPQHENSGNETDDADDNETSDDDSSENEKGVDRPTGGTSQESEESEEKDDER